MLNYHCTGDKGDKAIKATKATRRRAEKGKDGEKVIQELSGNRLW